MAIDQQEIDRAKALASQGNSQAAIASLSQLIQRDARNIEAWLALAEVVEEPERVEYCLKKVLALDPGNSRAEEMLALMSGGSPPENRADSASADVQSEAIDVASRLQSQEPKQSDDPTAIEPRPHETPIVTVERADDSSGSEPISEARPEESAHPEGAPPVTAESPDDRLRSELVFEDPKSPHTVPHEAAASADAPAIDEESAVAREPRFNRTDMILVGLTVIVGMVLCGLIGAAVVRNSLQPAETPDEVVQVVFDNIAAANREDFAAYMATIHPDSPDYITTHATIQDAFSTYDLSYEIFIPEMLDQGRNNSVISFVLTTRKIRGPAFRDNRVTGEMTLRKHEGEWKIYDQRVDAVQYLN